MVWMVNGVGSLAKYLLESWRHLHRGCVGAFQHKNRWLSNNRQCTYSDTNSFVYKSRILSARCGDLGLFWFWIHLLSPCFSLFVPRVNIAPRKAHHQPQPSNITHSSTQYTPLFRHHKAVAAAAVHIRWVQATPSFDDVAHQIRRNSSDSVGIRHYFSESLVDYNWFIHDNNVVGKLLAFGLIS